MLRSVAFVSPSVVGSVRQRAVALKHAQSLRTVGARRVRARPAVICTAAPTYTDAAPGEPAFAPGASPTSPASPQSPTSPKGVVPAELFRAVRRLAEPLYAPPRRGRAIAWTVLVVTLALVSTLYAVAMSTVLRLFWNTLNAKDVAKFGKLMRAYGAAVVAGPIILTTFEWAKARLALLWRSALTESFLTRYFAPGSVPYYRVATPIVGSKGTREKAGIDNSDQRLTDDVRTFTDRAVRFLCVFGVAVFDLGIFSVILFRIYPPLFFALIAYSLLGTVGVSMFGRPLVGMNAAQLQREADYRFALLRVRDNAESIAFYRGENSEKAEAMRRFRSLFTNALTLLGKTRSVSLVSTSHKYWVQVIPTLLLGPAYFAGKIALGTISQTMFSFNHVLSSMGLFVTEFVALSEFGAGVRRLDKLSAAMNDLEASSKAAGDGSGKDQIKAITAPPGSAPGLSVVDLSLETPSLPRRPLVQNLSIEVEPGRHLLLSGVSGVGKTSLLRAIAGLWTEGRGTVVRPSDSETLFLPQRPFLSLGSLRQNVLYPLEGAAAAAVTDVAVLAALDRVNLPFAAERMGGLNASGEDVGRRLSLGEQQRLAFARLVIFKPKFVLLDESTSALDVDNERLMYEIIEDLGATCVSVGNRSSLQYYHDFVLRLEQDGTWVLKDLEVTLL